MELQDREVSKIRDKSSLQGIEKGGQVLKVKVENGVVYKAALRDLLKMNKYYLLVHINDLREDDKKFAGKYKRYLRRPYIPFKLAKVIIFHIYGLHAIATME